MVGRTVSHYRIQSKLGEGGMGLVYKCEDTKLERAVALKFLAPHLVSDPGLRQRFEREAKAAALLDHPNICTVYEIDDAEGTIFLAMALVEGRTVKEMIAERPLKLGEALEIAAQTAEGLRAAHEKGIVHRDINPANIMVNLQKQVKIMDFGLAQLAGATQVTKGGEILGTPAYMSPEQTQGQPADHRTDIWSLGVMLYEMMTGRLPFAGERAEAILHGIREHEPEPVTGLRAGLPIELDWIIGKCMAKDPTARYQHADDLIVDLAALRKKIESSVSKGVPASRVASPHRQITVRRAAMLAAVVLTSVAITLLGVRLFRRPVGTGAPLRTVKFTFTPANLGRGSDRDIDAEVSISRDGKHITYVESDGGQLWVRDLDQEQAHIVPGAKGVYQVFWSPDHQFIGYAAGEDLVKIPVQGGTPVPITRLVGQFRRASYSSDGKTIVYCDDDGMHTVPAEGGASTLIIKHPHIEHPSFIDLPDGRRAFLFQAMDGPPGHGIYLQVEGESQRRLVTMSSSTNPYPAYSPTGHIVYVDGTGDSVAIWALPFSLQTLRPTGEAFPIAQGGSSPQVSQTGTLVYSDVPPTKMQLTLCDRFGRSLSRIGEPQRQLGPTLSPDGRKLAVQIGQGQPDIWIYDLDRGIKTRFTFGGSGGLLGSWSADGEEIAYASNQQGNLNILSKPLSGTNEARMLSGTSLNELAPDWSSDRGFLVYDIVSKETGRDLLYRERRADGSLGDPVVFLKTPFDEAAARFSPDGGYVVYESNESGRSEVYVRDFPNGAHKWQISTDGGFAPRWRRDGREILFVERRRLMAMSVNTRPAFSPSAPTPLFEVRSLGSPYPQYDLSADGKRFVVLVRPPDQKPLSIHVVYNWFEDFR